jgi:hypothetical protein
MDLTRRKFFLLASAVPAGAALAGCATFDQQAPAWIAAMQAINTEISLIMPQLTAAGLSGTAAAQVSAILAQMQKALSAISVASTQAQGASVLVQVEQYINALAPLVLPFVSLIPGGSIIGLIVAALPAIELAVNTISNLTATAVQLSTSAPPLPASGAFRGGYAASVAYMQMLISRAQARSMARFRKRHHH